MNEVRLDLFHGLFAWHPPTDGRHRVSRHANAPTSVPDPATGRNLQIATVDVGSTAICPDCRAQGEGGFVSFVADLRMAYACPACQRLVWVPGA
jgi:hypothetical protein